MDRVSLFRLYLLRATYLFIVVGLGFLIWPSLLNPPEHTEHMRGVVRSLLAGVSLLALLGLRYPLQMLPLLLFELVWKSICCSPSDCRSGRPVRSTRVPGRPGTTA